MFIIRLLSRLPFSFLYLVSDIMFVAAYHLVAYRRKMVQKNLRNSFPEKSTEELKRIEKEFYRNLCDYVVETLKLITLPREALARRMVFKNTEMVYDLMNRGHSIIHLASHQFNWEWVLVRGSFTYGKEMDFVYQPVKNKFFDRLSQEIRVRFGAIPIKRRAVGRELIKRKNIQHGIAIVADQYPGHATDKRFPVSFLNQETVFFYSPQQLATLTQYPVIFYAVKKLRRGYYEVTAIKISEPPYAADDHSVVVRYAKAVEAVIREYPSGWLWSHNRWKTRHLNQA